MPRFILKDLNRLKALPESNFQSQPEFIACTTSLKLPRNLVAICSPLNEGSAYMGLISKKPSKNSCDIILKVQRSCCYYSAYTPTFHSFLSSIKAFLKFIAETRLRASDREVLSVNQKGILDCSLSFRSRASV